MKTNNNQILAMFTLSRETDKNNNKLKHLITSVVKYNKKIDFAQLYETLTHIAEISKITEPTPWNIIRISLNDIEDEDRFPSNAYFNLVDVSIDIFLNEKIYKALGEPIFYNFFKDKKLSSRTVYIFEDISWENIVLLLKLSDLYISGGSSSKRHLISTVQVNLIEFLLALENFNIDLSIIYNSFKEDFFSKSSIDLNKYNHQKNLTDKDFNSKIYSDNKLVSEILDNNNKIKKILSQWLKLKDLEIQQQQENKELINLVDTIERNQMKIKQDELLLLKPILVSKKNHKKKSNLERKDIISNRLEERKIKTEKLIKQLQEMKSKKNEIDEVKKEYFSNDKDVITKFEKNLNKNINSMNKFQQVREFSSNSVRPDVLKQSLIKSIQTPTLEENEKSKALFSYLDFIDDIIKKSNNDPYSTQKNIEFEWINFTKSKIDNFPIKINKNLSYIIKNAEETLDIKKENKSLKRKFSKLYERLGINELLISISIIISQYRWSGFTSIAMRIANEIIFQIYRNEILEKNKIISIKDFGISLGIITEADKLRLGAFFIEIFSTEPTCLFERSYKNENDDTDINDQDLAILVVNEEFSDLLKKDIIVNPNSLPMLCKPNKWDDNNYGGFLMNKLEQKDLITTSTFNKHEVENKTKLYNAINYLNTIKFKINTSLLNYLENEGKYLLDSYYKELESKSAKLHAEITLKIAKSYSKIKIPFYINTFADWRSRIYSYSYYINYQGNDLSSALLNFYEGMPINESGKYFLYLFGANCHNENKISKKSYNLRINWVKNNYDKIINLDPELILKAESKFMFTSFCLTMKELHTNPKNLVYIPVYLDATCSGIQHLAAMLKDLETGSKVNLIPQKISDSVGDIYSDLIGPINEAINKYGRENKGFEIFKTIELNRSHIKQPIMTKVYNVSVVGIANQLRSNFKIIKKENLEYYKVPTKDHKIVHLSNGDVFKIAQILDEQIFISLPSLKGIYTYFKEIIRFLMKLNLPIIWFTPAGLEIRQHYLQSKQNKISISYSKTSRTVILREVLDKLDKNKQVQAIIPNIIHSLDASHLINLINTALDIKFTPIISIHDCFGTHPNNFKQLLYLVKTEFVLLYTKDNFLDSYHNRFLETLKDNQFNVLIETDGKKYIKPIRAKRYLPIKPKLGELDLTKIKKSKYLIA
uniref:DNA-directed RNA polymerase n=1 Tax=Lyophyllum semitale TaxID=71895 RepID=A0A8H2S9U8_9AGAR|nr:RNA polymerase [Lyophyllum semitale]